MSRRALAAFVLVALTVGGLLLDRHRPAATAAIFGRPASAATPIAAPPADALSASWFCPGAPAAPGGSLIGTITVANNADRDRIGSITIFPSAGEPVSTPLTVPARKTVSVRLGDVVTAPYAATLVELERGDVTVEQTVTGPLGTDHAPCATTASSTWFGADGTTTLDATFTLFAFNPFPETAVVDLGFLTDQGRRDPQGLQGLVIPGRSLQVFGVNDVVLRSVDVGVVATARSGRIVMGRLQRYDGTSGRKGTVSGVLATSPGTEWWFPDGETGPTAREFIVLANPTDHDASVRVEPYLDPSASPVDAIAATVPAGAIVTVALSDVLPAGRHTLIVRSLDGTPVVVERRIDNTDPTRMGTSAVLGARLLATHWSLAAGEVSATMNEEIVVANPTGTTVTVTVATIGATGATPVPGFENLALEAGETQRVTLGGIFAAGPTPVVVDASAPVVVERVVTATDLPTVARSIAIPTIDR
jgi:hypothetical protein